MLQILIDGQASIRQQATKLEKKVDKGFQETSERLNKIGSGVVHLEDDAPTNKEFDSLEKRVSKVEKQVVPN